MPRAIMKGFVGVCLGALVTIPMLSITLLRDLTRQTSRMALEVPISMKELDRRMNDGASTSDITIVNNNPPPASSSAASASRKNTYVYEARNLRKQRIVSDVINNEENRNDVSNKYANNLRDAIQYKNSVELDNDSTQEQEERSCLPVVRKKAGLFDLEKSNSPLKSEFDGVVLLVAANYAYYNMLQNWEYLAAELGLQWVVLALDDKLYEELGPDRAIPPDGSYSVSGAHGWGRGKFKALSCNKIRMALEVATGCGVDVVFTDADNVFFKNPFEHDLGNLIRSKRYDYLYQSNKPSSTPRSDQCIMNGHPRNEANTGFYYFNHRSQVYKTIAESTLERCKDPKNDKDDQTLFWQEVWNYEKKAKEDTAAAATVNAIATANINVAPTAPTNITASGGSSNKGDDAPIIYHHCIGHYEYQYPLVTKFKSRTGEEEENATFNFCCLDRKYTIYEQKNKERANQSICRQETQILYHQYASLQSLSSSFLLSHLSCVFFFFFK